MFNNNRLHWTTVATEKFMLAVIGILTVSHYRTRCVPKCFWQERLNLLIYSTFYIYGNSRNGRSIFYLIESVTLPTIIAMTVLCRLIVLHPKDADPGCLLQKQWLYLY